MSDKNKKSEKQKKIPVFLAAILILAVSGAIFFYVSYNGDIKKGCESILIIIGIKKDTSEIPVPLSEAGTLKKESSRTKEALKNTSATIAVLRVGEETVYYPEFAFYVLASKKRYEQRFGRDIWSMKINGERAGGLLREDVVEELIQLKIIVKEAEKEGVFLGEAENKEIISVANEQMKGIDPVIAAKYYIDADIIAKIYRENFLANKFFKDYSMKRDGELTEGVFKELYIGWKESYSVTVYEDRLSETDLPEIDI